KVILPSGAGVLHNSTKSHKNIKVDGTAGGKEQSDDGKQVTLTPFVFDTLPFDTVLYTVGYDAETKEGVLIFLGMYDAFPISYDLQLKNSVTGQVVATAKGSASFDNTIFEGELSQWFLRAGQVKIPVVLPEDLTNFKVQGFYTDGFGIRTEVDRAVLNTP
ncbi:MAG TPA: hypothetical protein PKD17_14745, partial [Cellvibrionaceae bacterium]|nr:hypothetical protein [Cellvibrionaceae bacterium]HMW73082.1 hypothetical protein [Cellvibrionaceae bacterium]